MIRFRHAVLLARTKLKSKRALLFISVGMSSLLFATLIAGIVVFTGAEKSASRFVSKANEGVYRVQVDPVIPENIYSSGFPLSIDEIRRIRTVEKRYYSELEAKYKAAGLKYDRSIEVSALEPSAFFSPSTPEEQRYQLVYNSPVIIYDQEKKLEAYIKTANNKSSDLKTLSRKYNVSKMYKFSSIGTLGLPNVRLIQNGKEKFTDTDMKAPGSTTYGYLTNAMYNGTYMQFDQDLVNRYMLPRSADQPLKGIPVIVTAQEAASLFGKGTPLEKEPTSSQEKFTWLKKVQAKFNGHTYQSCYRNASELTMLDKIQRDYADITNHKSNDSFVEPSLLYEAPKDACGSVVIKKDTRTAAEKQLASEVIETEKKLGSYVEPQHRLLTFEIVGIIHARPYSQFDADMQSYLQNLLAADNFNSSALIPQQLYDTLPETMKLPVFSNGLGGPSSVAKQMEAGLTTHVLDFKTPEQARSFINNETCPSSSGSCTKLYRASPYGSNFLILDEIGKLLSKVMIYALPVVLGLAALIMWFTMVRIMSENRKETAVYRAMGAKRRDIMSIYMTYTLLLTIRIALLSLIGGVLIALVIHYLYGPELTATALASFGTVTSGMTFDLLDFNSPLLYLVVASIFIISFLATFQPLIRNVRRSPIEDMRGE